MATYRFGIHPRAYARGPLLILIVSTVPVLNGEVMESVMAVEAGLVRRNSREGRIDRYDYATRRLLLTLNACPLICGGESVQHKLFRKIPLEEP